MKFVTLVLTILLSTSLVAQAPSLSELERTKLEKLQLQAEAASLRIALLQAEIQRVQSEFNALMASLEKPGFKLLRNESGVWVYSPAAPPPSK